MVRFGVIVPRNLDKDQILDALKDAVKEEIEESDKQFAKTYRTHRHKPEFVQRFEESSDEISGITETSGEGSRQNPYPFIVKGTSVRYATMTPDFEAKTAPRIIDSTTGRGGLAYIDTRRPRPGIEAREFDKEIALQEQPKFAKRGQQHLDNAARKSNHTI